ncbi:MAG: DUF3386 family protein, partial [Vicinamibacterales bacterium]
MKPEAPRSAATRRGRRAHAAGILGVALAIGLSTAGPLRALRADDASARGTGGGDRATRQRQDEPLGRTLGAGTWESYFPFRLGDSWTYEWETGGRLLPKKTALRTRVFEGTEFLSAAVGYRLVSDDGTYHLYTMTDGVLRLHSSSEAGRLLFYDPPVVLASPEWRAGEPHVTEQPEAERTWTATIVGLAAATVPFGALERAMTVKLEMKGPDFVSQAVHVFAPKIGLVQYDYRLSDAKTLTAEVEVHAKLRFARLANREIRSAADLSALPGTVADGPVVEDRSMRELLRKAVERRYTWDPDFPGVAGTYEVAESGQGPQRGQFSVARDLSVKVDGGADAVKASLRNDISSFVTQRKPSSFDLTYAETTFKAVKTAAGDIVFTAEHDPLATTYTVKDGDVVSVGRSLGRLRYTANERT